MPNQGWHGLNQVVFFLKKPIDFFGFFPPSWKIQFFFLGVKFIYLMENFFNFVRIIHLTSEIIQLEVNLCMYLKKSFYLRTKSFDFLSDKMLNPNSVLQEHL